MENAVEEKPVEEPKPSEGSPVEPTDKKDGDQELILKRFKNQDELIKAYQESESALTQKSQRVTELERSANQPPPAKEPEPQEDEDSLFWEKPLETIKKVVAKAIEPLGQGMVETQKDTLRKDPDFAKYEPEIDAILDQYPQLRQTPHVIPQIYKMVKGMHVEDMEKELRVKWEKEQQVKEGTLLEGAGVPETPGKESPLTAQEKTIAYKMFPDVTRSKAEEEYAKWK
jgi:hypothetical protein|tara:strand:- start:671 stop:1354 length:684 start_codon:yes stop_codon:yes gene_type:complete